MGQHILTISEIKHFFSARTAQKYQVLLIAFANAI